MGVVLLVVLILLLAGMFPRGPAVADAGLGPYAPVSLVGLVLIVLVVLLATRVVPIWW